jgi:hypothetical protein
VNTPRDLLRPTLDDDVGPAPAIHSATTGYLAAFLGGPIGGALIALENARRLRRLSSDAWLGAVAVAATLALVWWEQRGGGRQWLLEHFGTGGPRMGLRAVGLAYFATAYYVHRRYYRNMAFYGIEAPSGWVVGLGATVAGALATAGLTTVLAP